MITCYFQYSDCVFSPPTQFLQLSPRLGRSIVSMSVFFFFICLFAFQIFPPPITAFPTLGLKENNKIDFFNSLQAFR